VKNARGEPLSVKWVRDEQEDGWYWVSFDVLLFGGPVSLNNYVLRGDLVRFKRPGDRRTHVGQVTAFGVHDDRYMEPLVSLVDVGTQEKVDLDIESVRPLHANWKGDRPNTMKLDAKVVRTIKAFDEERPAEETTTEYVDALRQVLERHARERRRQLKAKP
jgi:hypothetical protein